MLYRREIDGLRALAVVPVILFHAGFPWFSGGFVGVDVFFVISGYLITSIILDECHRSSFSLLNFYERRVRRILPALILVMAACIPFAWVWLPPADLKSFCQSLVAVSVFSSNILFWKTSGYFDTAAELKPLLHTWSLAVEEQYYLLFPAAIALAWRLRRSWIAPAIALVLLASFVAAQWDSTHAPSAAFYLLHSRGWELLVGSLVAWYLRYRTGGLGNPVLEELGALAGFALICYATFRFDRQTPFPGAWALLPTLGTALIVLFATDRTRIGRLLGSRILVGIGLISYSAYLWHQPLLAFARHRSIAEPSAVLSGALAGASVGLAYLSWKYVELPFRDRRRFSRRQLFAGCFVLSALIGAFGLAGNFTQGLPNRLSPELIAVDSAAKERNPRQASCHTGGSDYLPPDRACMLGNAARPIGALVGDSQADSLAHALELAAQRAGVGFTQLTYSGCPPVPDVYRADAEALNSADACDRYNRDVFDHLVRHPEYRYVILSARWTLYLERTYFDNGEGGVESKGREAFVDALVSGTRATHDEATRRELVAERYRQTVLAYLRAGKVVVLVYPVPEAGWDVPSTVIRRAMYSRDGRVSALSTAYDAYLERNRRTIEILDSIGAAPNLLRVRPAQYLCNGAVPNRCVTTLDGLPLYTDSNHLSDRGARPVVDEILADVAR